MTKTTSRYMLKSGRSSGYDYSSLFTDGHESGRALNNGRTTAQLQRTGFPKPWQGDKGPQGSW